MALLDERDGGDLLGDRLALAQLADWCRAVERPTGAFARGLAACYGDDAGLLGRRLSLYRSALDAFRSSLASEGPVFLAAVPSRINWEGHHVDHQGGHYNATTHERELVVVCQPRADHHLRLANADEQRFPSRELLLGDGQRQKSEDWSDYVVGALLAVARRCGCPPPGMNLAIASDIPIGSSLSSSHALVLGAVLAAVGALRMRLDRRDAVLVVQEGEWFAGSRTGLGDQATMLFGRRGYLFSSPVIDRDGLKPRHVRLPEGHERLILDSFTHHRLSGRERIGYNARVFAYRIAFPLVLAELAKTAPAARATRRLADIHPESFPQAAIYGGLRQLPCEIDMDGARRRVQAAHATLRAAGVDLPATDFDALVQTYFPDGTLPAALPLRGVALYGIAECWRSRLYSSLVERGDHTRAGRLVYRGHDGDRVSRRTPEGHMAEAHCGDLSDAALDALIGDLASPDPERQERAALEWQSGDYRASVPELDALVDICRDAGALSASLTGAGLGGVVTATIERSRVPALASAVLGHLRSVEDEELGRVRRAARQDAISKEDLRLVEALVAEKRSASPAGDFAPRPAQLEAIARCAQALEQEGHAPRLLDVDYQRRAITVNHTVAGAGFMPAPAP